MAKGALSDPSHRTLLLTLLYNSHDLDTVRHILYVLANAAADHAIGRDLLDPVTAHVGQFMECADVMRPVMLFYRTIVRNNLKVVKKLAEGPGMGLIMKIFSIHQHDEIIRSHFVDIAKEIFKGHEIEEQSSVVVNTAASMPDVSSAPRVRRHHDPSATPSFEQEFSYFEEMRYKGIFIGEKCAFVEHCNNSKNRNDIAKHVYSMLNHKGGEIFVGVEADKIGKIKGMKLSKKTRDDFNLLIDDILTDSDIMKRTKGSPNIPQSLVEVKFEKINNTFNTRLDFEDLVIARIKVQPLGAPDDYAMFNSTNGASVDYDSSKYVWVIYTRDDKGLVELSLNQVRQRIADEP